ncbi:hypothetical protein KC19_VG264700 [Ceratodon purpureus]|uniref:Secreted protein n=1 Tax=Ceratodon purpureus TaxID=3225 RepID=A0A8T0HUQ2_CERPU|nr:hypothetical protein KC19_VG264700 [Ceratodon purpureus]
MVHFVIFRACVATRITSSVCMYLLSTQVCPYGSAANTWLGFGSIIGQVSMSFQPKVCGFMDFLLNRGVGCNAVTLLLALPGDRLDTLD